MADTSTVTIHASLSTIMLGGPNRTQFTLERKVELSADEIIAILLKEEIEVTPNVFLKIRKGNYDQATRTFQLHPQSWDSAKDKMTALLKEGWICVDPWLEKMVPSELKATGYKPLAKYSEQTLPD